MLHEVGKAPEALLYSLLFVPELSIVADSVLLTNGSNDVEKRFLEAKRESRMPLDRLEASFNRIELPFLFIERSRTARSAYSRRRLPRHGGACWRCSALIDASWLISSQRTKTRATSQSSSLNVVQSQVEY